MSEEYEASHQECPSCEHVFPEEAICDDCGECTSCCECDDDETED